MKTATILDLAKSVKRISSDYTNGRTGTIVEMDSIKNRARVLWNGNHPKIWVKLSQLELI